MEYWLGDIAILISTGIAVELLYPLSKGLFWQSHLGLVVFNESIEKEQLHIQLLSLNIIFKQSILNNKYIKFIFQHSIFFYIKSPIISVDFNRYH